MSAVLISLAAATGCGGGGPTVGVGWSGGVQILVERGVLDTAAVTHMRICVETTCHDVQSADVGPPTAKPRPAPFEFAFADVHDRSGAPTAGGKLHVEVTLLSGTETVIATGKASATLGFVDPTGWFCDELVGRDRGPVVAVEFDSSSHLSGVNPKVPRPSCPRPSS